MDTWANSEQWRDGPVILFQILGSYHFLHIWENIFLKLGESNNLLLKYMKLGK